MNLLQAQNCTLSYDKRTVLTDIGFSLAEGGILALVGASGSGKSSLLRLIAALQTPDKGEIFYRQQAVSPYALELVPGHPHIKLARQDFSNVLARHTVRENLRYALQRYEKSWQNQRIDELLTLTGLTRFSDQIPAMLSGGEQQRLAIAVALAESPSVLLLDEPFSHLDIFLRRNFKMHLKECIEKQDIDGIVLVVHEPQEALALANQILVLQEGRLVQCGTPQQIYQQPANRYVAGLFAEANILSGAQWQQAAFIPEVFYMVRPEQIQVLPHDATSLKGRVKHLTFEGKDYLADIVLENGAIVVAAIHSLPDYLQANSLVSLLLHAEAAVRLND